jgi:nitrile hydratase accessory protein
MAEGETARLDVDGPAAPPRENGELVFSAPWESRTFGITMALCDAGVFDWESFRRLLIEEIAVRERSLASEGWSYYACWQRALERVLADAGLLAPTELDRLARVYAERPDGHDH